MGKSKSARVPTPTEENARVPQVKDPHWPRLADSKRMDGKPRKPSHHRVAQLVDENAHNQNGISEDGKQQEYAHRHDRSRSAIEGQQRRPEGSTEAELSVVVLIIPG